MPSTDDDGPLPVPSEEEFEAAGLLDRECVPTGRLDLLRWLADAGFTVDEMVAALDVDGLGSLMGDHRLVPGERLAGDAALAQTELGAEALVAMGGALGFRPIQGSPPGEVGYTSDELNAFGVLSALWGLFTPDEALSLVRTIGSSFGRMADASVSLFLADVESPLVLGGKSELDLALSVRDGVGVIDGLAAALDPVLRRLVLQSIERTRRTSVGNTERFEYRYAVGFVDLVGFTELAFDLEPEELGEFIRDFEGRAHDLATSVGGQVVKTVGDEVMFVADDAAAACRVGRALMEGFASPGGTVLPRGGLAYGNVLPRGGDYYGVVVNLAARLVDEAVPQEMLVTEDLAEAAVGCEFEPAGRRMVKGFADPIPVRSLVSVSTSIGEK
ncbi:MAG: adenylate/guanylate cyclase domain-containing protein [Acidimicrobiia bacterium]|nr:adenylate/guanylate cyclase domain-containing protein [Acidimicrobiia bacterium]